MRTGKSGEALVKWLEDVKSAVANTVAGLTGPEDDVYPALFVQNGEGELLLGLVDPEIFATPESKTAFSDAMPGLLGTLNAERFALLCPVWTLHSNDLEDKAILNEYAREGIEDAPERREALLLLVGEKGGPAQIHLAQLWRDGEQPPVLREWEDVTSSGEWSGRFIKAWA